MKMTRWIIVFSYVILMFVTIPYVPKIWNSLTQPLGKGTSAILNVSYGFIGCYIILYSYFKLQKKSLIFYSALGLIFLCYSYLLKDLDITIEKVHLLEYGVLSFLVYWAIKPDIKPYINGFLLYSIILGIVFLIGLSDELVQKITPGRVYEFKDVLLNWKAGTLGLLLVLTFKKCG